MPKEYSFSNQDGTPIYHRFELEREGPEIVIVLKSGSSAVRGDGTPHNSQYNKGVERLFSVLSEMEEPINKVVLDTRVTRRLNLTLAERTLSIDYPILCWDHEPSVLRKKLGGLAQNIGQESGARGGNNQKQLRVYIRDINPGMNLQEISNILSGMDVGSSTSTRLPIGLPSSGETLFTRSSSPEGWLYVVTNPKWPEWVKIGVTRDLTKRLSSYNTGAPISSVFYRYEYHRFHENARVIEHMIHTNMADSPLRGDSSEWYQMSIHEGREIIDASCVD